MRYLKLLFVCVILTGCDGQSSDSARTGSIMEHMASSAVGGLAAGAGAAIGHHAINHGINKWRERRAFRRR
jgi:hypothetical protein